MLKKLIINGNPRVSEDDVEEIEEWSIKCVQCDQAMHSSEACVMLYVSSTQCMSLYFTIDVIIAFPHGVAPCKTYHCATETPVTSDLIVELLIALLYFFIYIFFLLFLW